MTTNDPRMASFDAVMYGVEGDPLLRSVIVLVVPLDSDPDAEILLDRVDRMSRVNSKLRRRVVGNDFSLAPPRWEPDPNFDLDYHLRWQALPEENPGLPEVLELAEYLSEQDFDHSRPLWEMTIVTGLENDEAAIIWKIHHSITDGVGGMQMAAVLFDLTDEPNMDLGPMPEAPEGHSAGVRSRISQGVDFEGSQFKKDVSSSVSSVVGAAKNLATDPTGSVVAAQEFTTSAAKMLAPQGDPLSPIWNNRSLSVTFSVVEVPLDDLKNAARKNGCTLNDAFMTAVTGAIRDYHRKHGASIEGIRVNMPINFRKDGDASGGNEWVPARFVIPTNVDDTLERMQQLHPVLDQVRHDPALSLSSIVYRLLTVLPRPITTNIAGSLMKGVDVAATNVPGPPIPVYTGGAKVTGLIPFAPKAGAAVNIGLMSYNGTAFVGINCDPAAVTDPELFTECFRQAVEKVIDL